MPLSDSCASTGAINETGAKTESIKGIKSAIAGILLGLETNF
jgi:hypothetical protein